MSENVIYDALVIGGGPAGQSAAIYLTRFNRHTLVIDRGSSRTLTFELNENYLGFPEGIHSRKLYELGRQQAQRFGAIFVKDEISHLHKTLMGFEASGFQSNYHAKTVILATGVTDLYPNLPNYQDYLGKSLFWCITCDGFKTMNKRTMIVGADDEAACTALQFLEYTSQVTVISNYQPGKHQISQRWLDRLRARSVPLYEAEIVKLHGHQGWLKSVELETGEDIATDYIFNLQGAVPNNNLAVNLGVTVNQFGYVETSDEQRTNVPFVYAAGDITRMFAHQIVTAAHEGSMAAQAANYDLYADDQRMD